MQTRTVLVGLIGSAIRALLDCCGSSQYVQRRVLRVNATYVTIARFPEFLARNRELDLGAAIPLINGRRAPTKTFTSQLKSEWSLVRADRFRTVQIVKANMLGATGRKRSSLSTRRPILSHRSFRMTQGTAGRGGRRKSHATTILLATRVATCYPRSVNRNIFYIIGVIVVIVIVLKVLGLF
jgi:hypothetical protein